MSSRLCNIILLLINLLDCFGQFISPCNNDFFNDFDCDGIPDVWLTSDGKPTNLWVDNCLILRGNINLGYDPISGKPVVFNGYNPNQADYDGDGIGDACDNCPFEPNFDQNNSGSDIAGDACKGIDYGPDTDGDGIPDILDNCPDVSNPVQEDSDFDGIGNACDPDIDGDLILNEDDLDDDQYLFNGTWLHDYAVDTEDNCPFVYNYGQVDLDGDGVGDWVYDNFTGITWGCDNCVGWYNPDQLDSDGDGVGDVCDLCPFVSDPRQINTDTDGIGDPCDNCIFHDNYDQSDVDADGVGDVCDNCPYLYNPDQLDSNGDGIGDCCTECPFDITLVSIGNITIEACPLEIDCDCTIGLRSITLLYLNELSSASSITFYYSDSTVACPIISDVSDQEEIVCTLDVDGADRFPFTTSFTIEYEDGTMTDCSGTFDTSCTESILGTFGDGCSDLVITSWTDIGGGICTGNISVTKPDTTEYTSESESSVKTRYWKYKDASDDSSDRRRMYTQSSDSSEGVYDGTESWYSNTKCISNCVDWGLQRGLTCGCHESCNASTLTSSCFSTIGGGYCSVGICCCGVDALSALSSSDSNRRLLDTNGCSDSDDSSSSSAWYSYAEWYQDRCGISAASDPLLSVFGSSASSSDGVRRRRQLLGASFGSMRNVLSSSSSANAELNSKWSDSGDYNDFLIETCITYEISSVIPDCFQIDGIFLPLCENEYTDFNSTNLNVSDITELITDETFESGSNVLSAEGVERDGQLGILVTLMDYSINSFEICVGNVTVNAENVDTLNITIDTSSGVVFGVNIADNNTAFECPIDGLPCFNFFFDAECPTPTTAEDAIYRSCDCEDGMVSMELEYVGTETVSATFFRSREAVYDTLDSNGDAVSYSHGDVMTVDAGSYSQFRRTTWVALTDTDGETICSSGRIPECSVDTIGSTVQRCSDLMLVSWSSGDGALCDEIAADSSASSENAFINKKESLDGVWKVFEELDSFILYSLIGIMFASLLCLLFFGYCICSAETAEAADELKEYVGNEQVVSQSDAVPNEITLQTKETAENIEMVEISTTKM